MRCRNAVFRRACAAAAAALASVPLLAGLVSGAANFTVTREDFDWRSRRIPRVDVFTYGQGGENLFPFAVRYLTRAYQRSRLALPVTFESPFPFFLYNNHNDFEQTNITPVGEGTGGVTEAFKDRLLLSHTGSQRLLEYITAHEFTHEVEYEYLFSGWWRTPQLLSFILYPHWLMEGLAEYVSGDLDYVTREMYLRDAATSGGLLPVRHLFKFNHVLPHQVTLAYKESEALMHYIAREYGEEALPALLATYRGTLEQDIVLRRVLGVSLRGLERNFLEFMQDSYKAAAAPLREPESLGRKLTPRRAFPVFNEDPVFSPDGTKIAFLSDWRGPVELYLMDAATGETRRLVSLARSARLEQIHDEGAALSFSPDGRMIAFTAESGQRDFVCLYDLSSGRFRKHSLDAQTLASPAFSPDGGTLYLSAQRDGYRDLYAWRISGKTLRQLTSGPMDDIDVFPAPDGRTLFFAAERENPAGRIEYDLARFDVENGTVTFITSLPGDERYPSLSPDGSHIYFISNQDGVNDIYRMTAGGEGLERLTRVIGGNFQPRVSPDNTKLVFSSFRNTRMDLYLMDLPAGPVPPAAGDDGYAVVFDTAPPALPAAPVTPSEPRRYGFKVSTDLFLPALFYSSEDGLFLLTYWQLSEYLGNHQLSTNVSYASEDGTLNYQVGYGLLPFRTKFYVNLAREQYYTDFAHTARRQDIFNSLTAAYPLNRFEQVVLGGGVLQRRETINARPDLAADTRENIGAVSFVHDTSYGPYLEPITGYALVLSAQFAGDALGGDSRYQNYQAQLQEFFHLGGYNVLYWSPRFLGSFGEDRDIFRLGGQGRVRGYPSDGRFEGNRLLLNTVEWRFPLVYNLNYELPVLGLMMRSFYGLLFVDTGVAWNEENRVEDITLSDWEGSFGTGVTFNTFILQTAPISVSLQVARRIEVPEYVFYFDFGYAFTISFPFVHGD